jgi:iron complex transport system substrate-binding protein
LKIVSLLPAATEIVCALGLYDELVGRSHECDFPEKVAALPPLTQARVDSTLGSHELDEHVRHIVAQRLPIYMLNEPRLAELAPEVVVTQAACEVCAISYDQVLGAVKRTSLGARVVSLQPSRLAHVLDNVREVASACEVGPRGDALVSALQRRLDAVASLPGDRPRVAVIEWLAPPMLAGHWIPDVIAAAGATYVGPEPGAPSPYVAWEELASLRADAVIVAPCGFDLARTLSEARPLAARLREVAHRILFMDGNAYMNRPGPRLVDAIETIHAWLKGESVDAHTAVSGIEALAQGG